MGSAVLEVGRSADIHEFYFQAAKRLHMNCVELQGCLFADCQEWHFLSRNVQIIAVTSWRRSICWCSLIVVTWCEKLKYVQTCPAMRLICWFSGIAFSGSEKFKNVQCSHERTSIWWYTGIVFWGFETFTYGLFRPVMWSFCWFSRITFSGFETFKYA